MRGRVMLRCGILLVVEIEGREYSIIQGTRDQAELGDFLDWNGTEDEVAFANETRGANFRSAVLARNVPLLRIRDRLRAFQA
jgi:hypothetical protein